MKYAPAPLRRYGLALALSATLAACGGGDDGPPPPLPPLPAPGAHRVALPGDADVVNIELVDLPDLDLPEIPLQSGGAFAASVPAQYLDEVLLLRLRKRDASGSAAVAGAETSDGSPGATRAYLLATGRDLEAGSVAFNPVTDYITRQLLAFTDRLPPERLRYYQDTLAAALIAQDLTGDGMVDYRDALAFAPGSRAHLARLDFDYQAAVQTPLDGGPSLLQTYAAPPAGREDPAGNATGQALTAVFDPLETVPLPNPNDLRVAVLEFDADYGGSVAIDELPGMRLDAENPRLLRRVEMGDAPPGFTLRATPRAGMRFARWVGCPQEQADGACRVTAAQDARVGAQFQLDSEALGPGIAGVVKLGQFPDASYTVDMDTAGLLRVGRVTAPALAQQLAAAGPGHVIATLNWRYPLRRITAVQGRAADGSIVFATAPVAIHEVYQAFSTLETGRAPTIDDVQAVRLDVDDGSQSKAAFLKSAHAPDATSASVWIPGYGKALEAGGGFYLAQNPAGRGFVLVNAPGGGQAAEGAQAERALRAACAASASAPDCAVLKEALLTRPLGEIKLVKYKVLTGTFKVTLEVDVTDSHGSFTFLWSTIGPGFDLSGNMRGNLTVSLLAEAFLGFQGEKDFAKSLSTKMCGTGQQIAVNNPKASSPEALADKVKNPGGDADALGQAGAALGQAAEINVSFCAENGQSASTGGRGAMDLIEPDKLRLAIQLNNTTPDGVVLPLKVGIGITAKAQGKLGLDAEYRVRQTIPYDVDVDLGSACTKVLGVTACTPPGVAGLAGLKKQRAEGKMGSYTHQKWRMGLVANAEYAPGVDLTLTWGPRAISESLVTIGAGISMPVSVVGQLTLFQNSNFPEDVAAQLPGGCSEGYSYAIGQALRVGVYGKIVPKIDVPLLAGLRYGLDEVTIFSKSHDFPIKPPVLHLLGWNSEGADSVHAGESCRSLAERPARFFRESYAWGRGELNWDTPKILYTRNRKLALQSDGNFVLYALQRANGGQGGITGETALWSSNTYGMPGARVAFNGAGLLTVHDLRERQRFTSGARGERLELRADGALVLLDGAGRVAWRAAGT